MSGIEVAVGRIAKAHGVREVAVDVLTDEPDRRFAPDAVFIARGGRPGGPGRVLTLTSARRHHDRLLVTFAEIGDRAAAESVRGQLLQVTLDPDEAPEEEDAFYDHQLVGLRVEDTTGKSRGVVTDVRHGAQDLLVIDADSAGGGREVLVPFVVALVPEVDVAAGRLVVADRPGLLDPDEVS